MARRELGLPALLITMGEHLGVERGTPAPRVSLGERSEAFAPALRAEARGTGVVVTRPLVVVVPEEGV